jgi:hypothetical protein
MGEPGSQIIGARLKATLYSNAIARSYHHPSFVTGSFKAGGVLVAYLAMTGTGFVWNDLPSF